jgi:hypothetical protein
LGTSVTNQSLIQEEIKRKLNSGDAWYRSVQNHLSSRLLSKNIKIRIYKPVNWPVVLCGCETWSLTIREANRLRVLENSVLRSISGAKGEMKWREVGENYIMRSLITCTVRQV